MKKIIFILVITALFITSCNLPENNSLSDGSKKVKNKEIILPLSFGSRIGTYTGIINSEGLPDGQGTFTATGSIDSTWSYTGSFVNGHFEGNGEIDLHNGYIEKGVFMNDQVQPLPMTDIPKVYSNPMPYQHYCIEIYGKVFNVINQGESVMLQMYQDIENSDRNTIVYSTAKDVKSGDLVKVFGNILGIQEYENTFGNKMTALELYAKNLEKASYIDAISPTIKSVNVNSKQTQNGYSVTVQKVEFAKNETRVYIKVENQGKSKFSLYRQNVVIEQDNKQFTTQPNYSANYPEIQMDLRVGNVTEGIIPFPVINQKNFKIYIGAHSEDWNEKLDEMIFDIEVR